MAMTGVVFNRFPEIAAAFPVQLHKVVVQTTEIIQQIAQSNAPVRTGFLRDSITTTMLDEFTGNVTVGAYYGIYVEMGTRFMAAQPYFYPAVEEGRSRFEAALAAMESFL
jgi:HK97 gp10 family phage protein